MNRKNDCLLFAAAAVCAALFALFADGGAILMTVLRFPFGPIGSGLRWLSLAGEAENILAWILYVLLCSIPALLWWKLRRTKADLLLLLLTPVLALVLYGCINPFGSLLATAAGTEMVQAQYGAVVYVLLVSWLILRAVQAFRAADEAALYRALGLFLKLLGVLFVVSAFGGCLGELLTGIDSVRAANQNSGSLTLTYVFLALQCLTDALPLLLNTATVLIGLELLTAFAANREDTALCADRLAHWCGTCLTVTALTSAAFHVLQLLCLHTLRNVNASVSLPIGSMAFLLVCLMAARIIAENKALQADNDLFI